MWLASISAIVHAVPMPRQTYPMDACSAAAGDHRDLEMRWRFPGEFLMISGAENRHGWQGELGCDIMGTQPTIGHHAGKGRPTRTVGNEPRSQVPSR
jgi:hypothetical protein